MKALAVAMCVALGLATGCAPQTPAGSSGGLFPNGVRGGPVRPASNCPVLPGGTGILPDGDFSEANDPAGLITYDKGQIFAPYWEVVKGNVDFNGSTYWNVDGLCSIDLDGYYTVGGIESNGFFTKEHAYTLSFVLSGNGDCAPAIKTMEVDVDDQVTTYTWNTASGNDAQDGDFETVTWHFQGKGQSLLKMKSLDPKGSSCGAVVAGISVTKEYAR